MIDYDSILSKDTSVYAKSRSESYFHNYESDTLENNKNFIWILLPLTRKNVELVAKRGCQYLVISANTCTDVLIAMNALLKN